LGVTYNVTLREGDAVFLYTGWEDLFLQFPVQNATYNGSEPGISIEAAEWLVSQKVVAVGADTAGVEVIPFEDPNIAFPVHVTLLPNNGIHIIENVRTDLIAAEARKTGRATFFLSMSVPKAVGLTGTFVAPEAIRCSNHSARRGRRPAWGAGLSFPPRPHRLSYQGLSRPNPTPGATVAPLTVPRVMHTITRHMTKIRRRLNRSSVGRNGSAEWPSAP
jgi:hypothetical protein